MARFTCEMSDTSGKTISMRGLTYYRLAEAKIVEDDPITNTGSRTGARQPDAGAARLTRVAARNFCTGLHTVAPG